MSHARTVARSPTGGTTLPIGSVLAWLAMLVALLWAFWLPLRKLRTDWQGSGEYSIGQLVPFVALYLLWHDRADLRTLPRKPAWLLGIAIILIGQAAMLFGLALLFESAERYGLVLTVVGVIVMVVGRQVSWRIKWILLFLFLMVPLPGSAVFALELFGTTVTREGNVMVLNEHTRLAVAEACSGLRMLTAFIVVAATFAYVIHRPRWQRVVLLLSSIPIAIACNTARLMVTAWLFLVASSKLAETFFHDFAGLTMMPIAVLLLALELWLMNKIVVPEKVEPIPRRRRSDSRRAAGAA